MPISYSNELNNTFLYRLSPFPVLLSLFSHSSSPDHLPNKLPACRAYSKVLLLEETKLSWWDQRKKEGKKLMNKLLDAY